MLKWQGNHNLVISIWSCYDMLMITCGFVFFPEGEHLSFSSWIYTLSKLSLKKGCAVLSLGASSQTIDEEVRMIESREWVYCRCITPGTLAFNSLIAFRLSFPCSKPAIMCPSRAIIYRDWGGDTGMTF